MFYRLVKTPIIVKTGKSILNNLQDILLEAHLFFPHKTLVTQGELYSRYKEVLDSCNFSQLIIVNGGSVDEFEVIKDRCNNQNTLLLAFGGGAILDIVKYSANKLDLPYITIPSTLSNDAIYSCVARLISDGKKTSFGVVPPIGIIVDLDIIRHSPTNLILARVADLMSNLSATSDWLLSHKMTGEPINEIAFMLAKEATMPMFQYSESDITTDAFLLDLTNGLITSGLSMIISGDTRGTSGAEHLISHAIDEFFPEKSTIHGIQVGWAHLTIEKKYRRDSKMKSRLIDFYEDIGLTKLFGEYIKWNESDLISLIPYAMQIRNRYTVFNTIDFRKS